MQVICKTYVIYFLILLSFQKAKDYQNLKTGSGSKKNLVCYGKKDSLRPILFGLQKKLWGGGRSNWPPPPAGIGLKNITAIFAIHPFIHMHNAHTSIHLTIYEPIFLRIMCNCMTNSLIYIHLNKFVQSDLWYINNWIYQDIDTNSTAANWQVQSLLKECLDIISQCALYV